MRVTAITSAVLLLLSEFTTAKQLHYRPRGLSWRRTLDDDMRRTALDRLEGRMERRQSSSDTITPASSSSDTNSTIVTACLDGLSGVSSVQNSAGITACYNILNHNVAAGEFEADLRLYLAGERSGDFVDIKAGDMMIGVNYAPSTTFEALVKRSLRPVARQTSGMTEMQQYSLKGHIAPGMELSKLNSTELMSLMVPQISINAVTLDSKPISTNISATETAYFVVGEFQGEFSREVVSPTFQQVAIRASSKFVLPGTTFGIFPTGFIVTTAWMILFLIAYGVGTVGRLRHRKVFRARRDAVGGRVGTRF